MEIVVATGSTRLRSSGKGDGASGATDETLEGPKVTDPLAIDDRYRRLGWIELIRPLPQPIEIFVRNIVIRLADCADEVS